MKRTFRIEKWNTCQSYPSADEEDGWRKREGVKENSSSGRNNKTMKE